LNAAKLPCSMAGSRAEDMVRTAAHTGHTDCKDNLPHSPRYMDNATRKADRKSTSLTGYRYRTERSSRKDHMERNCSAEKAVRTVVYKVDRQVDMAHCI